jgi:hypothetical protein
VVFAEAWRGTYGENVFDGHPILELSANYLGLPVNAAKGGDDEQRDSIIERRSLEIAPRLGGSGDK